MGLFYSALLNKTGALVKFANIGLDYHKRTDNTSWHRTSDEWNYLITNLRILQLHLIH